MDRRNLKLFRVKNGLTQVKMAEKIGVALSIYSQIENGKRRCSENFLIKLQNAFDIPDSELWALTKIYEESEDE